MATLALEALSQLTRQPETSRQALSYAEDIFHLNRHSRELGLWGQLYSLLSQLGSPLRYEAQEAFTALVDESLDVVSPEALRLYLALSLQETINLAAAQMATDLSPRAGAACAQELRDAGLISTENRTVSDEVARTYFERHPQEKLLLLSRLREHTPVEQAHPIYRAIYELSQTFGGMGYWQEARGAYVHQATTLIEKGDFQGTADVLGQLQKAEHHSQQTPNPESRFLQAYALERLRHYQQGLEVLTGVQETPEIISVRAALLARTANFQDAKVLAQQVKNLDAASPRQFWVKAIALNTLGQIAYEENSLLEADVCFTQAALQWALAGHPQRELGALMNRANTLEELNRSDEAREVYEEVLKKCALDDVLRVRTLLNLGYIYEDLKAWQQAYAYYSQARAISETYGLVEQDRALVAAIYNNLGYTQVQLGHEGARANLSHAAELALEAGERFSHAAALSNLALVDGDIGKFAVALDLFEQLGSHRELAHYGELYKQMLQERIETAKEAEDTKSLHFLEETLTSFRDSERSQ